MKKNFFLLLFLMNFITNAQSIVLGSGSDTPLNETWRGNPIDTYYENFRYQVIYSKTDLLAAGLSAGDKITGLGFSVCVDYGGGDILGYSIRLGHTSAINSFYHQNVSLTLVKNAFNYNPTVVNGGEFDIIPFDTFFTWDGDDNILVDICNTGLSPYIEPFANVRRDQTVGETSPGARCKRDDGSGSLCGVNTNQQITYRPQIKFTYTRPNLNVENLNVPEISIFPNPAQDILKISSINFDSITFINSLGQIVQKLNANNITSEINISNFPKGIYHVIFKEKKKEKILKLIKE